MAKINVNDLSIEINRLENGLVSIQDKEAKHDLIKVGANQYHLLLDDRSYRIEVLEKNSANGELRFLVNGREFEGKISYKIEQLLQSMGMQTGKRIQKDVKAPMPGLVLDILVNVGDEVKEGDDLLILEAMKMENAIKSPQDGIIESISVAKQGKVDKNDVLVSFEQ